MSTSNDILLQGSSVSLKPALKRMATYKTKRRLGGTVNSSLNKNTSLNSTLVKRTLRANNRDLAQALERKKAELRRAQDIIVQLQGSLQSQMLQGKTVPNIDELVEEQVQKRLAFMLQDTKRLGETLIMAVSQLYKMTDRCSGGRLSRASGAAASNIPTASSATSSAPDGEDNTTVELEAGCSSADMLDRATGHNDDTNSQQTSTESNIVLRRSQVSSAKDLAGSSREEQSGVGSCSSKEATGLYVGSSNQQEILPSSAAQSCHNDVCASAAAPKSSVILSTIKAQRVPAADKCYEEDEDEDEESIKEAEEGEDSADSEDEPTSITERRKSNIKTMNRLKNLSIIMEQSSMLDLDDMDISISEPIAEVRRRSSRQSLTRRSMRMYSDHIPFSAARADIELSNRHVTAGSPKSIKCVTGVAASGSDTGNDGDILSLIEGRDSISLSDRRRLLEELESPSAIFSVDRKSRTGKRKSRRKRSTGTRRKSYKTVVHEIQFSPSHGTEDDDDDQADNVREPEPNEIEAVTKIFEPVLLPPSGLGNDITFAVEESKIYCNSAQLDDEVPMVIDDSLICSSQPDQQHETADGMSEPTASNCLLSKSSCIVSDPVAALALPNEISSKKPKPPLQDIVQESVLHMVKTVPEMGLVVDVECTSIPDIESINGDLLPVNIDNFKNVSSEPELGTSEDLRVRNKDIILAEKSLDQLPGYSSSISTSNTSASSGSCVGKSSSKTTKNVQRTNNHSGEVESLPVTDIVTSDKEKQITESLIIESDKVTSEAVRIVKRDRQEMSSAQNNILSETEYDKSTMDEKAKLLKSSNSVDKQEKKRSSRSRSKDKHSSQGKETFLVPEVNERLSEGSDGGVGLKRKFSAYISKPGQIVYSTQRLKETAVSSDSAASSMLCPTSTDVAMASRYKPCSTLPVQHRSRSKSGKSCSDAPREASPVCSTKWDYKGTPPVATADHNKERLLAVFDLSLNDSAVIPTKPAVAKPKQTKSKAESKQKGYSKDDSWINDTFDSSREQSRNRARHLSAAAFMETSYSTDDTELCSSPHGIMLRLGNGKRTKPRSKPQHCKFVSYSSNVSIIPVSDNDASGASDGTMLSQSSPSIASIVNKTVDLGSKLAVESTISLGDFVSPRRRSCNKEVALTTAEEVQHNAKPKPNHTRETSVGSIVSSSSAAPDVKKSALGERKSVEKKRSSVKAREVSDKTLCSSAGRSSISAFPDSGDVADLCRKRSIEESDLFHDELLASPKAKIPSPAKPPLSLDDNQSLDRAHTQNNPVNQMKSGQKSQQKATSVVVGSNVLPNEDQRKPKEVTDVMKVNKSSVDAVRLENCLQNPEDIPSFKPNNDKKIKRKSELKRSVEPNNKMLEGRSSALPEVAGMIDSRSTASSNELKTGMSSEPVVMPGSSNQLKSVFSGSETNKQKQSKKSSSREVKTVSEAYNRLKLKTKERQHVPAAVDCDKLEELAQCHLTNTNLISHDDEIPVRGITCKSSQPKSLDPKNTHNRRSDSEAESGSDGTSQSSSKQQHCAGSNDIKVVEGEEVDSPVKRGGSNCNQFLLGRLSTASNDSAAEFRLSSDMCGDDGRRSRRAAKSSVSYKEPSLGAKLRRGDPFTSTIYNADGELLVDCPQREGHRKSNIKHSPVQKKARQRRALSELEDN